MRYLIDGYNLMYALGLARRNGGRAAWDRGRRLLLDWLAEQHGPAARDAIVVLDAQNARGGQVIEESHRGLRVLRKAGRAADDMIEDLLNEEPSPETLTVVSNDARVREAANRRGCVVRRCEEYVDAVMDHRPPATPASDAPEKDEQATPAEMAEWLEKFGG
ncbi:MAG TPA: NYN domain-containing protein [Gemmataceae bacterium]|nr:NYN domain-containing protein [Gemmataceae bacterium]